MKNEIEKDEFMDARFIELMMKFEEMMARLDRPKPKAPTLPTPKVPENHECGEVCYTRLYKADEELMEQVCKKYGRKKAQVIRILVSDGLRKGVLDEGDK